MPSNTLDREAIDVLLSSGRRGRKGLWATVLLVCLGVAAALFARPTGTNDRRYETVAVERRNLVATVSATGKLGPTDQVDVGSEISGIVADVRVDTNDRVERGQTLALIDTTKLEQQAERSRAALLSAEAALAQNRATRDEAVANLARLEEVHTLSDGRVPSKAELDAARAARQRADAAVEVAIAGVAESRAGLSAAEIDLEKSVIRSPIDGIVLNRRVEPGQTVAASFQAPILFTLGRDLRRMDLTVYVSEADVGRVVEGQVASFTVDAWPEAEFEARVRKVSFGSQTIENVVSYEAELEVANDDLKLRPGMTATAVIRVAERESVLVVSNAALRFRPPAAQEQRGGFSLLPQPPQPANLVVAEGGDSVYIQGEDGLVRVSVVTGLEDGRRTEVAGDGLAAGKAVVVGFVEDPS